MQGDREAALYRVVVSRRHIAVSGFIDFQGRQFFTDAHRYRHALTTCFDNKRALINEQIISKRIRRASRHQARRQEQNKG